MTDILLDTIAFDFLINAPDNIPTTAQNLIENARNKLYLSVVSIWEISIQVAQQKIVFAKPFQETIEEEIHKHDIILLELSIEDTHIQASMPFLTIHGNLHKDPFDRIIVAQAIARKLSLISSDRKLPFYPVTVIWN
jgi:PIN domain nuclease of toxin-antitoxin system